MSTPPPAPTQPALPRRSQPRSKATQKTTPLRLWQQLDPLRKRQLVQHLAGLIRRIHLQANPVEEANTGHDPT